MDTEPLSKSRRLPQTRIRTLMVWIAVAAFISFLLKLPSDVQESIINSVTSIVFGIAGILALLFAIRVVLLGTLWVLVQVARLFLPPTSVSGACSPIRNELSKAIRRVN